MRKAARIAKEELTRRMSRREAIFLWGGGNAHLSLHKDSRRASTHRVSRVVTVPSGGPQPSKLAGTASQTDFAVNSAKILR